MSDDITSDACTSRDELDAWTSAAAKDALEHDWQPRALSAPSTSLLARAVAISAASTALRSCGGLLEALRMATEIARTEIGLERVAFYIRERNPHHIRMRGTWGTDRRGETTNEQSLFHDLSPQDTLKLLRLRATAPPAWYRPKALQFATEQGRSSAIGVGWVMVTPLFTAGRLTGVMYNDAALTGAAPDPDKQLLAAILCSMVAVEHAARVAPLPGRPLALGLKRGSRAERARSLLAENPRCSGRSLALTLEISEGHLAREFKRETGVSLVEYRNRLRLERFQRFASEQSPGHSLKRAASEAGFGSYAQFKRVHKQLVGTCPTHATRGERNPDAAANSTDPQGEMKE